MSRIKQDEVIKIDPRPCTICGNEYQPTAHKQKYCPCCAKSQYLKKVVAWQRQNPEKVRQSQRKYYQANREKLIAVSHRYNREHQQERAEYRRKYYEAHREQEIASNKAYVQANAEKVRELKHKYYMAHRGN